MHKFSKFCNQTILIFSLKSPSYRHHCPHKGVYKGCQPKFANVNPWKFPVLFWQPFCYHNVECITLGHSMSQKQGNTTHAKHVNTFKNYLPVSPDIQSYQFTLSSVHCCYVTVSNVLHWVTAFLKIKLETSWTLPTYFNATLQSYILTIYLICQ